MGVALVKLVGLLGMAWAILVSQLVTAGGMIPVYACRRIGLPFIRFVWEGIVPPVVAAVPALIVAVAMRAWFPPAHLFHVVVQAACVGVVTGVGIFFICFERQMQIDVLRAFFGTEQA